MTGFARTLLGCLTLLAVARPAAATPMVGLTVAGSRALVEVQTPGAVTVEWGEAPFATKVVRAPAGRNAVVLEGLRGGRTYLYRVRVNGVEVQAPTPFRVPGVSADVVRPPLL